MSTMTALGRETKYAALFAALTTALLSPAGSFKTIGRRYVAASKMQPEQYPALFLVEAGELYEREPRHGPLKVELIAHLVVQSYDGPDPSVVTATDLNALADAVESAVLGLTTPGTGRATLGAAPNETVDDVYITGREVVLIGTIDNPWSEFVMEVSLITRQAPTFPWS